MSKASWVFNLKDDPRGIARVLGPGLNTRIFPGEQVMLSVVRIDPHAAGSMHSHPEEQWGVLLDSGAVVTAPMQPRLSRMLDPCGGVQWRRGQHG